MQNKVEVPSFQSSEETFYGNKKFREILFLLHPSANIARKGKKIHLRNWQYSKQGHLENELLEGSG